jgi:hypothetical protein
MSFRKENLFFHTSAALLLVTASAKLYSATGSAGIFRHADVLVHINVRLLMIGVALMELAVAGFLARNRDDLTRATVLLWLSGNFMIYRFANHAMGITYCPCLGTVGQNLPISHARLDFLLDALVLYWFLGSGYLVWRVWAFKQEAAVEAMVAARQQSGA